MSEIKVYYSTEDNFPPYRVDVGVLFSQYLNKLGMSVEWYMRRRHVNQSSSSLLNGQLVHLPYYLSETGWPTKLFNKLAFWLSDLFWLTACLWKSVDIIQVRDKYIAAIFGLLIARLKQVPFVYWCSYPFPEHYLEQSHSTTGLRRLYCWVNGQFGFFVLYKFVVPLSHHSFVQSSEMSKRMHAYGIPKSKMSAIPMGVPDRIFEMSTKANKSSKRFVYIGTLASVRRMHVLIQAFSDLVKIDPSAELFIVGEGDVPAEKQQLELLAGKLNIKNAVNFTGFLPMDQAWEIAAESFCCISPIYPSPVLRVGSPTKLIEYLALGKPVICNDHPEQKEILDSCNAGLCVSWSKRDFTEAMAWMLSHPKEAEIMGARGPDWVKKNRTYSVISKTLWERYKQIVSE